MPTGPSACGKGSPAPGRAPGTSLRRRVVIVEDHTIIRDGLRALIGASSDLEVVGEASNGLEALSAVRRLEPDLVLMDLSMPKMEGIEAIREIVRGNPRTRCLALTMRADEESFHDAMRAGARGYVLKDAGCPELLSAMRKVVEGRTYISPDLSRTVLEGYLEAKGRTGRRSAWDTLTPRERQILKMVAEGGTNRTISEELNISPKTVDRHRSSLMQKLDLHSTSALTVYAVRRGLVTELPRSRTRLAPPEA